MKRVYTEQQKARRRTYLKAWKAAHPERVAAINRASRKSRREHRAAYNKAYCEANPERVAATKKAWRAVHREHIAAWSKAYGKANREQKKLYARQYQKLWRSRNKFRISLKKYLHKKLKSHGKSASTMKLIGCDLDWLRAWLEVHFQPGMTWENYGPVWHVDHKRPCASFNLSDPVQQKLCWHWTNLQPLFAWENINKGDKWDGKAA